MAGADTPDGAILDLQMSDRDGISVAAELSSVVPACVAGIGNGPGALSSVVPACVAVIVTGHGRAGHLKRALEAGVRGFLPKTVSASVLSEVVRTVHRGGRYVDPELAAEAISAGDSPLTPREADVLELAAGGAPVDEIAARAHLSPGTVRNHLSAAAMKLGARNRHAAGEIAP